MRIVEADEAEVKRLGAAKVKSSGPGPCGLEELCDVGLLQCENGSCKEFDDDRGYCVELNQILGNNGYDQCSDACDCIGIYKTEKGFYSISGRSTIYQYFMNNAVLECVYILGTEKCQHTMELWKMNHTLLTNASVHFIAN